MSTSNDTAPSQKKWCVMVYLAADIELESAAMDDLGQMKAAGSSSEVDVLAQLNPGGARAIRELQRVCRLFFSFSPRGE